MPFVGFVEYVKACRQKPLLRQIVALLASAQQSFKYRSLVHIYIDRDGDWRNCRSEVTFVSTELHALSFAAVEESVMDQWCYDYRLKEGDIVVDIGAGIGDEAVVFSKLVGPEGCVIAIEAHPRTFRCLEKTIALNGLKNIIAVNLAVSDQEGEVGMSDGENYQTSSMVTGNLVMKVGARRLDNILRELAVATPNLVKINIEGAELAALRGMEQCLQRIPHIAVSCHDFIADRGGNSVLRTYAGAKKILQSSGFDLRTAREDSRPWFRYYLYGSKGN